MSEVTMEDRANALENEYFRRQESELLAKMRANLAVEGKTAGELNCPKCDGKLVETDFENIKIDVCNKCHGVWLDAGELARVTHQDEHKSSWFGRLFE